MSVKLADYLAELRQPMSEPSLEPDLDDVDLAKDKKLRCASNFIYNNGIVLLRRSPFFYSVSLHQQCKSWEFLIYRCTDTYLVWTPSMSILYRS